MLLHFGADPDLFYKQPKIEDQPSVFYCDLFPMYIACKDAYSVEQIQIVTLLLKHGARVNRISYSSCRTCDSEHDSLLYLASKHDNIELVKLLLANSADPNMLLGINDHSPLFPCIVNNNTDMLNVFLSCGAQVKGHFSGCEGAGLLQAAASKSTELVNLLLALGADINSCFPVLNVRALHVACVYGSYETVKCLLKAGADVNAFGSAEWKTNLRREEVTSTALGLSCKNKDVNLAKLLLQYGANPNLADKNCITPLQIACREEHADMLHLLLDNGANLEVPPGGGEAPLLIACQAVNKTIVDILLSKGADITKTDNCGNTVLHHIALASKEPLKTSVVSLTAKLLASGAQINQLRQDGLSPLFLACHSGNTELMELLLMKGADANIPDANRVTPLLAVCMYFGKCHELPFRPVLSVATEEMIVKVVQLLTRYNAKVNIWKMGRATPLHYAVQQNSATLVNILLQANADPNICNSKGQSPLCLAVHNSVSSEEPVIAKLLLSKTADVNMHGEDCQPPLVDAVKGGKTKLVQLLLEHGANPNCIFDKSRQTALHFACKLSVNAACSQITANLINHGADVTIRDSEEFSPLDYACCYGSMYDVKVILDYISKNVNIKEAVSSNSIQCLLSKSKLHIAEDVKLNILKLLLAAGVAVDQGWHFWQELNDTSKHSFTFMTQVSDLLLENGADVMASDANGIPCCFSVLSGRHRNLAEVFLKYGADPDVQVSAFGDKMSALCKASGNNPEMTSVLIKRGSSLCSTDELGNTPLHIATQLQNMESVRKLLHAGAPRNAQNQRGQTALHVACSVENRPNTALIELLLSNGCNKNITDNYNRTPMLAACKMKHFGTVTNLLEWQSSSQEADITIKDITGSTALHYISLECTQRTLLMQVLSVSQKYFKSVNCKNNAGDTALHLACRVGNYGAVDILLQCGADMFICNKRKQMPLHLACSSGNNEIVEKMISLAAGKERKMLQSKDDQGLTPGLYAAAAANQHIVEYLIHQNVTTCRNNIETYELLGAVLLRPNRQKAENYLIKSSAMRNAKGKKAVPKKMAMYVPDYIRECECECVKEYKELFARDHTLELEIQAFCIGLRILGRKNPLLLAYLEEPCRTLPTIKNILFLLPLWRAKFWLLDAVACNTETTSAADEFLRIFAETAHDVFVDATANECILMLVMKCLETLRIANQTLMEPAICYAVKILISLLCHSADMNFSTESALSLFVQKVNAISWEHCGCGLLHLSTKELSLKKTHDYWRVIYCLLETTSDAFKMEKSSGNMPLDNLLSDVKSSSLNLSKGCLLACSKGHIEAAACLLVSYGAMSCDDQNAHLCYNMNVVDNPDMVFHIACGSVMIELEVIKILYKKLCEAATADDVLHKKDHEGKTPLLCAALSGKKGTVEFLVNTTLYGPEDIADGLEVLSSALWQDFSTACYYLHWAISVRSSVQPCIPMRPSMLEEFQGQEEVQSIDEIQLMTLRKNITELQVQAVLIQSRIFGRENQQLACLVNNICGSRRCRLSFENPELEIPLWLLKLRLQLQFENDDFTLKHSATDVIKFCAHNMKASTDDDRDLLLQLLMRVVSLMDKAKRVQENIQFDHDAFVSLILTLEDIGDESKVIQFLSKTRDLGLFSKEGTTLLHILVKTSRFERPQNNLWALRVMIAAGFDINARNSSGDSPLHLDLMQSRFSSFDLDELERVECMIDGGAHVDACNNRGKSAIDYCNGRDYDQSATHRLLINTCRLNLSCTAARLIISEHVAYENLLPQSLCEFVKLHKRNVGHDAESDENLSNDYMYAEYGALYDHMNEYDFNDYDSDSIDSLDSCGEHYLFHPISMYTF